MLMDNLIKLDKLSWKERGLLAQSLVLLPLIHIALILLGYARLRRVIEVLTPLQPEPRGRSVTESFSHACEVARIVSIAAEHGVYRATCLRKSMLLWWFLRRD